MLGSTVAPELGGMVSASAANLNHMNTCVKVEAGARGRDTWLEMSSDGNTSSMHADAHVVASAAPWPLLEMAIVGSQLIGSLGIGGPMASPLWA